MTSRRSGASPLPVRRWPLWAAIGSALVTLAGVVLLMANGGSLFEGFNLVLVVVGTVYAAAGGLLAIRVPGNRLGPLFLVAAWLWALDLLVNQYAWYGVVTAPGSLPAVGIATWLSNWLWIPGTALLLIAVPVLFPDGHLPSPRWRPIVALMAAGTLIAIIGHAAVVWPIREGFAALDPDFMAAKVPTLAGTAANIGDTLVFLIAPLVAIGALVVRYRRSSGVTRQQMRWFIFATVVVVAVNIAAQVLAPYFPNASLLTAPALALVPIAIVFAMLRYRLYELDRIISRTVSWTILTVALAVTFVAIVVGLETLLAGVTNNQTLAVAASTLVAAALFQPLRARVQRAVDRRFNRSRVDAEHVVSAFAVHARGEADLGELRRAMLTTTFASVGPSLAGVWLRDGQ